jgi:hypothetical protein
MYLYRLASITLEAPRPWQAASTIYEDGQIFSALLAAVSIYILYAGQAFSDAALEKHVFHHRHFVFAATRMLAFLAPKGNVAPKNQIF